MKRVAILMYHELELPERPLCADEPGYTRYVVSAPSFRAHLEQLRSDGARGMSIGDAIAAANGTPRVAITFDDGCETDLTVAAPALEDAGFGATFYVTVEHLGRRGFLSKTQLRELSDRGFDIGSHAMTHRYLHDLPSEQVRSELEGSKKALEDVVGRRVAHFSCPGGRSDARVARMAREAGYESVATSIVGLNSARTDRFRLRRVAVMRGMGASELARIARGEGLARRRAQAMVLDAAKRLLGNARYERLRAAALGRARS